MDRPAPAARALALLGALASPVFLAAAVVAWVEHLWPATPLTLGVAAVAVLAGPLLAGAHLLSVREEEPEPVAAPAAPAAPVAPKRPPVGARPAWAMTPARARSLAFLAWRDQAPERPRRSRVRRRTVSAVRPEPKHDHLA